MKFDTLIFKNMYCFKNSIRYFLNFEKLYFDDNIIIPTDNKDVKNILNRTSPLKIKIIKDYDKTGCREIYLPNIYNFYLAVCVFENFDNFYTIEKINSYSMMKTNLTTGTFKENSYRNELQEFLLNLCIYDRLLIRDIQSFYKSIYTHKIDFKGKELFYTNMNEGETAGLFLGNYISLYFAELYLNQIAIKIEEEINNKKIDCKFKYFSDDFYFFVKENDVEKINQIFNNVLVEFQLQENSAKRLSFDYESYNSINVVERYWKTTENSQKDAENKWITQFSEERRKGPIYFYFNLLNQIIYRNSKIIDEKFKFVYSVNFFKGDFWNGLYKKNYHFTLDNIHQYVHLIKKFPEIILYSIKIINKNIKSNRNIFIDKLYYLFLNSLDSNFHEVQLYYTYALLVCNFDFASKKGEIIQKVLYTNNQLLISLLILETNIIDADLQTTLEDNLSKWFVNYHIILKLYKTNNIGDDNNLNIIISKYLLGKQGTLSNADKLYLDFYMTNIKNNSFFIASKAEIEENISEYIEKRNFCEVQKNTTVT